MNLNKLFPRLPIRVKLGIAFVLLSLIPLVLVAVITTRVTIVRLRHSVSTTLEREVQAARVEVEQALTQVEQQVVFLSDVFLARLLTGSPAPPDSIRRELESFMTHTGGLFRLKVIAADGTILFATGSRPPSDDEDGGVYYVWRGQSLRPRIPLLLPVELRVSEPVSDSARTVPAVAVLVPVRDARGEYAGVVVGEAYAAALFSGLERVPPALAGTTTGLVDAEHHFLYHSERKRSWESLLGGSSELARGESQALDSLVSSGIFRTPDHLGKAEPVRLGSSTAVRLTLFRTVPLGEVDRPVREFFFWVGVTGAAVLVLVVVLATVAGRQLTTPIYRLRDAASRLRQGAEPTPLRIETNDELEDLASDFGSMADALAGRRLQLETTVTTRTRELRQTHAELDEILEHSADAIVGLDAQGGVRVWNRGAEALFGYSSAEALGRKADTLWLDPARDYHAEQEYLEREVARRGAVVNFQTQRHTKDGGAIPVSLTQTALRDDEGRPLGTSLILRDTSLQATLEDQMRRSERLAAMSVMAAGLAHEINNPLAIIGNRLECMEDELRDLGHPVLVRDLHVLRDHTTRLVQLTRNLLGFARDPGERQGPVVLADLVRRLGGLLESTLASRNIRLATETDGDSSVLGMEPALETVCMNLVLNAADAMPGGGSVVVGTAQEEDCVRLWVMDSGPGIPEELRERIFEPFFTTKGKRGTGLGLSLCRSIIERHGGRIWVEGVREGGSRFTVRLPAIRASPR